MANTLVQFRANESERLAAVEICEQLGMDLPSYLRMCITRLVQEKGIPFSMKLKEDNDNRGMMALKRASQIAEKYGISDMSLEDINAEIAEARK